MNDRTRTVIIAVVTTVWGVNFGAGFFIADYKPDQAINGIFMVVVGSVFAAGSLKGKGEVKPPEVAAPPPAGPGPDPDPAAAGAGGSGE